MAKTKISISIPNKQLERYRKAAEQLNKPLAHVIAEQLQSNACRPTTAQLFEAAEQVRRKYRGFLSREQAIHITSVALNCLHESAKPC
jgi:ABC-type xylose transport system substrate-binding protein